MNDKRRNIINKIIFELDNTSSDIESVLDEEADAMESIPENLQSSERYCKMEDAVDALERAKDYIDDAVECLHKAAI